MLFVNVPFDVFLNSSQHLLYNVICECIFQCNLKFSNARMYLISNSIWGYIMNFVDNMIIILFKW